MEYRRKRKLTMHARYKCVMTAEVFVVLAFFVLFVFLFFICRLKFCLSTFSYRILLMEMRFSCTGGRIESLFQLGALLLHFGVEIPTNSFLRPILQKQEGEEKLGQFRHYQRVCTRKSHANKKSIDTAISYLEKEVRSSLLFRIADHV